MDTTTLREVTARDGPFATVYFDNSHDTEDAEAQLELRWRAIRGQLAEGGADERTLAALDTAVTEAPPSTGRAGRVLVASGGDVVLDEELPEPPPREIARVAPQPYLLPLLELAPPVVPHVVVVADRTGADLLAVSERGVEKQSVQGENHPVHKVRGGGTAYWSIQHRVEAVVERNASEVAREATKLADDVGAEVVILAGEVQARTTVRDELPPRTKEKTVEVEEGARAEGSDPQLLEAQVRRVIAEHAERRRQAVLERYRAEQGRDGGLAARGLAETTSALRSAAVEHLLIDGAAVADRTVWIGQDPTQVATAKEQLRTSNAETAETLANRRADEALPAAALAEGADVVPASDADLPDGVGALLRFAP